MNVLILSTAPDRETAQRLARELVERKLAACVNIVPGIESIYHWEGKIHADAELLLLIKTTATLAPETLAALEQLHPYDTPEGIVLPIEGGLKKYLAWIQNSTRQDCDSLG
jgi:periplasmic divalent cation tolerance protein